MQIRGNNELGKRRWKISVRPTGLIEEIYSEEEAESETMDMYTSKDGSGVEMMDVMERGYKQGY